MFKRIIILAMAFAFLTGCAGKNSSAYEELDNLSSPFVAIYGETGQMKLFSPGALENASNFETLLLEPGFIIILTESQVNNGLSKRLEEILKRNNFFLISKKERKLLNGKCIQLNFARNGKMVFFID